MNSELITGILCCCKSMNRRQSMAYGLNDTEAVICLFIAAHPECSQDDVVKGLNMDKTTVAKSVFSLEEKTIITREKHLIDKRKNVLHITKYGEDVCAFITDTHNEYFSDLMTVLTPEEQEQFMVSMDKLMKAAEAKLLKAAQ